MTDYVKCLLWLAKRPALYFTKEEYEDAGYSEEIMDKLSTSNCVKFIFTVDLVRITPYGLELAQELDEFFNPTEDDI